MQENRREWLVPGWLLSLAIAVAVVAGIAFLQRTQAEMTGTVAQTAQAGPDGTAAHPYADASECPAHTDVVFWPTLLKTPDFPSTISVCFVGKSLR